VEKYERGGGVTNTLRGTKYKGEEGIRKEGRECREKEGEFGWVNSCVLRLCTVEMNRSRSPRGQSARLYVPAHLVFTL